MDEKLEKKSIEDKVFDKIKKDNIKMKPKSYFALRGLLFGLGLSFTIIASFFFIGLIIYILKSNELLSLPRFGLRGIFMLMGSFPWLLTTIALLFIVISEIFARRYKFVYQKPLIYSIIIITITVLIGGGIFIKLPIQNKIFGNRTVCSLYYKKNLNLHIGKVLETEQAGLIVKLKTNKIVVDIKNVKDKAVKKGDWIMIIGKKHNGIIKAERFKKINPERNEEFCKRRKIN